MVIKSSRQSYFTRSYAMVTTRPELSGSSGLWSWSVLGDLQAACTIAGDAVITEDSLSSFECILRDRASEALERGSL